MRKCFFFLLVVFTALSASAQQNNIDAKLTQRLNTYMQLNRNLDFEPMMDYIYPALFKVAPRDAILQSFKDAFNNDAVKIKFDSIAVRTIGADFKSKGGTFKKIDYYMSMRMSFTDTSFLSNADARKMMLESMQTTFPGKEVSFNEKDKALLIIGNEIMFAVKENATTEWMFIGYEKNPELIQALFPQDVIAHFKL